MIYFDSKARPYLQQYASWEWYTFINSESLMTLGLHCRKFWLHSGAMLIQTQITWKSQTPGVIPQPRSFKILRMTSSSYLSLVLVVRVLLIRWLVDFSGTKVLACTEKEEFLSSIWTEFCFCTMPLYSSAQIFTTKCIFFILVNFKPLTEKIQGNYQKSAPLLLSIMLDQGEPK